MSRADAYRTECEKLPYLSVITLKHGDNLLRHGVRGEVITTTGYYEHRTQTETFMDSAAPSYIHVAYKIGEKDYSYVIGLQSTSCYFGGARWWFSCPLIVKGFSCGRRAAKLYLLNGYYGCINCHQLTYRSRIKNPRYVLTPLFKSYDMQEEAKQLLSNLRTTTYRGVPTKRYRKVMYLTSTANQLLARTKSIMDDKGLLR